MKLGVFTWEDSASVTDAGLEVVLAQPPQQ